MKLQPETSIIIRTFNEEKFLPDLLESIDQQDYPSYEVIVVDSGSYDQTINIAEDFGAKVVRIASHDFTFGYSLNVGISASLGKFSVIVSAHTKPVDSNWLKNLIEPLRHTQTAMVYGRQLGSKESKFSESQDFKRTYGLKYKILKGRDCFANNANSAVRRDLWVQHPFDESLPGLEDIEWARYWLQKNLQVVYNPGAAIFHIHEETWVQVRRRYYREAYAAKCMGVKRRRDIPKIIGQETSYLFGDLIKVLTKSKISSISQEIIRFRTQKVIGTVKGLLDGAAFNDPSLREKMYFNRSYQAVVIHGRHHATFEELDLCELKPGEVMIKVAYVGVCATDLEIFEGTLGYYKTGLAQYPIVPGHEYAGTIVQVGANIKNLKEGDPVVVECIQGCGNCPSCLADNMIGCQKRIEVGVIGKHGGYGEYVIVPGRFVHQLKRPVDLKKACLCEPIAVVLKGLRRFYPDWNNGNKNTFGIVGGGPLGHLCALLLANKGHEVTVFERNLGRHKYFEGIKQIKTVEKIEKLERIDFLIEATGNQEALETIINQSPPGTSILLLGLPYGKMEFGFEDIVAFDKKIVGSVGSTAADFRDAVAWLDRLDLKVFTRKIYPLNQFVEAWKAARSGDHLKVLLQVDLSLPA